jgi:hypothetical protein
MDDTSEPPPRPGSGPWCAATRSSSASRPTPNSPRQSKIFSRASTAFGAEPNTQACAVDLALPGTLPVMNKGAVERAIQFGLAIGAHIGAAQHLRAQELLLPRPAQGLPDQPVRDSRWCRAAGGVLPDGEKRRVRLVRAHLEEDAGKSLHEDFAGQTGIDLNRAGTPLLEIVTEPDMRILRRGRGLRQGTAQDRDLDRHLRRQHAGRQLPLRRQRLGAQAGRAAGHAPRDQEPEQLQVHAAGHRLRGAVADRRDRGRPARSSRPRCSSTPTRAKRARCAPRKTRPITATSPTRTCRRW